MKKSFTLRLKNIVGFSTVLLVLLFALKSDRVSAQVSFPGGGTQSFTVCENSGATAFNSLLTISDPTSGLTETWSPTTGPAHGTLSLSSSVATSTGGSVTPSGWTYTPTSGYSGSDVFIIQVSNGSTTASTTINVTINPAPSVSAITGTTHECIGATTTLSNATSGGTWFSSNTSVATISATGVVTGISAGTSSILYSVTNGFGCTNIAFATDTVLTTPSVSSITGSSTVCAGSSTTLSSATSGGTWTSGAVSIASVNISTGSVYGVSAGTADITYSVTNSCGTNFATTPITVQTSSVAAISPSGAVSVCIGATTTLTDATSGGSWSSADPSIATVNSSGVVLGLTTGAATIFYTVTNSCGTFFQTKTVNVITVPSTPASIGGITAFCVGASITLTDATSGGVWSSSNTSIATINPVTGDVYGITGGTVNIIYTVSNTCGSTPTSSAVTVSTVPGTPAAISGPTTLCAGSTGSLTNSTGSGLWSSTNTSVASIDGATGTIYGLSAGVTTISYTITNACGSTASTRSDTVTTVPSAPASISGPGTVCVGSTITLTDATAGGTWSSVTPGIATISTSGVVTGVSTGSTLISYTLTNFCGSTPATLSLVVNSAPTPPGAISGATSVCVGATTTLTDGSSGGTWASSSPSIATISTTGVVTGVSGGTTTISYYFTGTCGITAVTSSMTVNTVPSVPAIGGTTTICNGSSSTLTNSVSGGTWVSGSTSVATIESSTGIAHAILAGTSTISYTVTNVCGSTTQTTSLTVVDPPAAPAGISGSTNVCVGSNTTLTDATGGGTWSSTNPSIASITPAGLVIGVATGTAIISYTVSNFCGSTAATLSMTVQTLPSVAAITGVTNVCLSDTGSMYDISAGGVWASNNVAIATIVPSTGLITGLSTGSTTITYTVTNFCGSTFRTKPVTINTVPATPGAIGGPAAVCVGSTISATNGTPGGVWSSADPSIATISTTGTVTGMTVGTVVISYTVSSPFGCGTSSAVKTISVITVPTVGPITGLSTMCTGSTTTLADTNAGGNWISSNTTVAIIGAATGFVNALTVGTTTISHTISNGCGASRATFTLNVITVPSTPAAIIGSNNVCVGDNITLTDATSGGTWASGNTSIATVDGGGNVYGVSPGTVLISYTVSNTCGSSTPRTKTITVNASPTVAAIGGTTTICAGTSTTLTNTTSGGSWSSADPSIATVNSGTGSVYAVSIGTTTISYTVTSPFGCASTTATRSFTVITVPPTPPAITGTTSVCLSSTTTLSNATSGGLWSSATSSIATVNSTTGVVYGVTAGTTNITYTVTNSCGSSYITTPVTVNTVPASPGAISGASSVCTGSTTTFTNATSGGTWSSSATSVATVDPSSGLITGMTTGSTTISYTVSNGCGPTTVTKALNVITLPTVAAIGGSTTFCAGSSSTLTDATSGGVWSSSDTSIATINTTGSATGVAGGTATITYAVTNACGTSYATRGITVITTPTMPAAISGVDSFCIGTNTTLADATAGGIWSSTSPGVATISNTGDVYGVSVGTTTISYTFTNSCGPTAATKTLRVVTTPSIAAITGPTLLCTGSTVTLSSTTTGGTWISSNTTTATIGSSTGLLTGVSAGTTLIVYSVTNLCGTSIQTQTDTVINGTVPSISGASSVCVGSATTLTNSITGGTWSSSNFTIATVNPSTGSVTGVSGGNVTITYSVTSICGTNVSTFPMTINTPGVAAITGVTTVCEMSTTTLSDSTTGGVWNSSSPSVATIHPSTGVVTGLVAGATTIVYTVSNSCGVYNAFANITVSPLPIAGTISGPGTVCEGSSVTFTPSISGGTWTTSDTAIATASSTGSITGVSAGIVTITYDITNSCGSANTTASLTVNPLPHAGTISGTTTVCAGSASTLTSTVSGGSWSSSDTTIATVSGAGTVTGVAAGTLNITYTYTNSCGTDASVESFTVNAVPVVPAITGVTVVCEASVTTLADTATGGTWTSSDTTVATVDAAGNVLGVSGGTASIAYAVTNALGCTTTVSTMVTVNPLPHAGAISGTTAVCVGAMSTLSSTVSGGTWSTSATGNATISATGNVTGITVGVDTAFYTFTNTCGTDVSFVALSINPLPYAGTVTGVTTICENATETLSDTVTGGVWSSSSATIATVSVTGDVTGVNAGTANITYTFTNSCGTDEVITGVTINPLPHAGIISGTSTVCVASFGAYSSTISGGTWSVSDTSFATIDASGTLTGVSAGTVLVSYSITNSCGTDVDTQSVTIIGLPFAGAISGPSSVCVNSVITLSSTIAGGSWSSSATTIATVDPSLGTVTGVAAGTADITYTFSNSCGTHDTFVTITVNPLPDAGVISGLSNVCVHATITLGSSVTGGVWSSDSAAIATVSTTGDVTGVLAGTVVISYSLTTSCGTDVSTDTITVLPLPFAGALSGTPVVCVGSTTTLSSSVSGGSWSVSSTTIASVDPATGVVYGVSMGTEQITYTVTNSCGFHDTFMTVTVNPLPYAGGITGPTSVCVGNNITIADTILGGTWSISPTSLASITTSGVVTGIDTGTVTATYTYTNSCGTTFVTHSITVNPLPVAGTITGASTVCMAATTTMTNTTGTPGGTWTVTNGHASISSTGVVTGVSAGVDTVVYTATTATCGTATARKVITILPLPITGTIVGPTAVCQGASILLHDTTSAPAGTWSTTTPSVVSLDAFGNVIGRTAGTATISYTVTNSCGTASTGYTVTVNPLPTAGAISGPTIVCAGSTAVYTSFTSGGTFTTSNIIAATITGTGSLTALAAGTDSVIYTVSNSCGTASNSIVITVNPLPVPGTISGTLSACVGSTSTLTASVTGGVWSSSAIGIATVSTGGVVYAVSGGTATISYGVTNSCGTLYATATFTSDIVPDAGVITGASTVCEAATTTFSSPTGTAGGSWTSSNTSVANVGGSSGIVSGVAAGTATITYHVTSASCGSDSAMRNITVLPLPHAGTITGATPICSGSTVTLHDTATLGSWSSSDNTIATVGSTGVVTGVGAGTVTISYTVTNSCGTDVATASITVTATPSAGSITGITTLCPASTITLGSTGTSGGTWSSTVTGVATINPTSGVLYGVAGGTTTISYTVSSTSCGTYYATATATVSPAPDAGAISGATSVCVGSTIALSETVTGGSWTTSDGSIASVNTTGVVTGVAAGSATISYSVTNSCGTAHATYAITVNALPAPGTISGSSTVCVAATTTYTSSGTSGGIWTSSSPTVASVGSTSGIVYGLTAGSATITYTVSTASCGSGYAVRSITVNPLANPGTISGPTSVCTGASITMSETVTGGSWSVSGGGSITSGGVYTAGATAGTVTISYTVTNSCGPQSATYSVTVNPTATAGTITGPSTVCEAATITESTTGMSGGSWSTPGSSTLSIDAAGVITGIAAGTTTITYTVTTPTCGSDYSTRSITVSPLPHSGHITGYTSSICAGTSIPLSSTGSGGSWSTSMSAIASVGASSGILYGVTGGTATITYSVTNSCGTADTIITVSIRPLPAVPAIAGPTSVCIGSTITLTDAVTTGTWSTSSASVASIDATGIVYGRSVGTATISYTDTNSCGSTTVTHSVTVNPLPNAGAIVGSGALLCVGSTITLTNPSATTSGGTWMTLNASVATINTTGVVTGLASGYARIVYTVTTATCGSATDTATVGVTALPYAGVITGPDTLCQGTSITLTDSTTGGTWTSSNTSIAAIGGTGIVYGMGPGTAVIAYTFTNACGTDVARDTLFVRALPSAGSITGTSSLCIGVPETMTATVPGGIWHVTNSVATISGTGVVLGATPGNDTVYYTTSNICGIDTAFKVVTVNAIPNAGNITSSKNFVCQGDTIVLNNTISGGFWTTSNAAVGAFSGSTTGMNATVLGVSAGTVTITFHFTNYCGTAEDTMEITVRPLGHCFDAVNEQVVSGDINLYPNPATSVLHVDAKVAVNLAIVSPDGKVVLEQKNSNDIDVTTLANGVYMIMIYDENNNLLKAAKFVKSE